MACFLRCLVYGILQTVHCPTVKSTVDRTLNTADLDAESDVVDDCRHCVAVHRVVVTLCVLHFLRYAL